MAGIAASYSYKSTGLKRLGTKVSRLIGHLGECGLTQWHQVSADHTLAWCWSPVRTPTGSEPPATNYARSRQAIARAVYREAAKLGARIDPDVAAGAVIPVDDPDIATRLLTDDELQRVRDRATAISRRRTARAPIVVAALLSGGSLKDAAALRARDVDVDARTVRFRDGRVCALDAWSAQTIAKYLAANPTAANTRLCVTADTTDDSAVVSVTTRAWRILREADIATKSGASPRSIPLTAARRVLERDGIAAAARFLGSPSLDSTARVLGHSWCHDPSATEAHASPEAPAQPDDAAAAELSAAAGTDTAGEQK